MIPILIEGTKFSMKRIPVGKGVYSCNGNQYNEVHYSFS